MPRAYRPPRGRTPWERDLAAREVRSPEQAAERARKGRALVDKALTGQVPGDDDPGEVPEAKASPPAGYEYVSCVGCYRPTWGLPGSRCPACRPA
ncbi:hypothetical protein E1091_10270 [Micromonospora fluostatini]|uniref:Uncharacterized protein n=1 Tax=Micromonospora fluostatini TaxID=1629071 RepID=A0ABY2DHF0_9ACTN|nr:hypothetical protein E1091_10270 [Micromonospora fluostatini]